METTKCASSKHESDLRSKVLAKRLLEKYFSSRFANFNIDCESPDLQDMQSSVGVEVSRAMPNSDMKVLGAYNSIKHGKARSIEKCKKIIADSGAKYAKECLFFPIRYVSVDNIKSAINKKLNNLNKHYHDHGYHKFRHNELFILDMNFIDDNDKIFDDIVSIQAKFEIHFEIIYIYLENSDELLVIDMNNFPGYCVASFNNASIGLTP